MRTQRDIDLAVAALADRQYGIVSRAQLLALGLTAGAIGRGVRSQRLRPLHRGVYAVGHRALRREAYWLAAVHASGPGAVLSHADAAALWGLRPIRGAVIDVTVPTAGGRRARRGVRLHRSAALMPAETTTTDDGIPVTTPARTVLDLAATLPRRGLERALDQAEVLRLFDLAALDATIEAHPGRPGTPLLRAVLHEHHAGTTVTRSELEELFLDLCDRRGIARPQVNVRVAGLEVDFHWPDRSLVVEVDGYRYHGTRRAFERDRARDATLIAAGLRVLRVTHRQLTTRPEQVVAALQPRSISSIR
jgi:very-short-patch-repair endonuclease